MSIIEGVKSFFEECPLLEGDRINVNYLGDSGRDHCIETVPADPVIKKYVDGTELRQFLFVFASREFYDGDERQNTDTAKFYEQLASWIRGCGRLPELGEGLKAQSMEPVTDGYFYSASAGSARYQLQCRLIYRKGE